MLSLMNLNKEKRELTEIEELTATYILIQVVLFLPRLILNFLCLLVLIQE